MEYLPDEITSKIMRENNQSHIAQILNKSCKLASKNDFLETTCRKNVSLSEIKRYIAKETTFGYILIPKILHHGSVDLFLEFDVWAPYPWGQYVTANDSVHLKHINTVNINYAIMSADINLEIITDEHLRSDKYVEEEVDVNNDSKWVEFTTNYKIDDNIIYNTVIEDYDYISIFDLLTVYRIFKSRKSCDDIVKSFAYDETLRIFHQFINTHNTIINSMILFGYLYINMKVMNLPYSGPTILNIYSRTDIDKDNIDNYIINNYKLFIDEIPSMISDIKKYLYVIYQYDNII